MIPFSFNENRFSFFVADHLLFGQLCTNPKSDRNLLSCLKVSQCSTSEIGDAPLCNSCPLRIQVITTEPLQAPSRCKSGRFNVPRLMKTKFPATVMVFGVISSEGHITDLNPLDYVVWSYVENITNKTSHNTKASLIASICRVFAELPPALVEKTCFQFRIRIKAVIEAEGGYIE